MRSPPIDGIQYPTRSWREVCDIHTFIIENIDKGAHFDQWQNLTSSQSAIDHAVKYLENCRDPEFSELTPNRFWFSFRNGLLNVDRLEFFPYKEAPAGQIVAVNYFDVDFRMDRTFEHVDETFMDEPTVLDKILDTQLRSSPTIKSEADLQKVKYWIYVLLGRLLFPVGLKDNWQVIPFFCGKAGTGKSTLGEIMASVYRKEDVVVLQNKTDPTFGLSPLSKSILWMCLEVKRDFNLDQAAFQSMVSGEQVAIRPMYKEAFTINFTTPGLMCGNEPMSYIDNSNSVSRRVVMLMFFKSIESKEKDPLLRKKFIAEMDIMLYKIARSYKEAVEVHGHRDFWSLADAGIVPNYFLETRRSLMESTHPLATFLHSTDKIVFDARTDLPVYSVPADWRKALAEGRIYGIPFKIFKDLTKEFFLANLSPKEYTGFGWRPKDYESVMENFGIRVVDLDRPILYLDSEPYGGKWVVNCSESSHAVESTETMSIASRPPPFAASSTGPTGPTAPSVVVSRMTELAEAAVSDDLAESSEAIESEDEFDAIIVRKKTTSKVHTAVSAEPSSKKRHAAKD